MVVAPLMGKIKIHIAFHVIPGIFAAKILGIPIAAAGGSVQSKADSIKNSGFPGTSITGNQK